MANKDSLLKKRLIRDGIVLAVVLVLVGAGAYVLSSFSDDTEAEKQSKTNDLSAAHSEYTTIDTLLKSGVETNAIYNAYILNHNSSFTLKRDTATQTLASLREKFHLATLGITIEHLSDVPADFVQMKSGTLVKSDIKLTFAALTDNSVFGFIEALHHELPGIIVVSELKLTRNADVSRSILVDLSQHKVTPMVSGELSFIWLGIRPKAEEKPVDITKAPSPGNGAGNGR